MESRPDGGVLIGGILELDDRQRQAIDKDDQIRAAVDMVFQNGKLIDHQPIIIVGIFKIDQPDLIAFDAAIFGSIFNFDAIREHFMERTVVADQGGRRGTRHLAEGIFQGFGRNGWIDACQRGYQSSR